MTTSTETTIYFKNMRETKGTFVFQEVDKDGNNTPYQYQKVGVLYIKKRTFADPNNIPSMIKVTISYE